MNIKNIYIDILKITKKDKCGLDYIDSIRYLLINAEIYLCQKC